MSVLKESIILLVKALCDPRAAFILGAGASSPDVAVMRQLIQFVLRDFKQHVTGFVSTGGVGPTHYLFANAAPDETTRQQLLGSNIETFRMLIAARLHPGETALRTAPVQYRVLSMAQPGVPIINYNVDRLASKHCCTADIKLVHGEIPEFADRLPIDKAVRLTQEGLEIIPESSFWLPEPESEPALLGRIDPAYRAIREASQIVIIGYSFGMTAGGMFDEVSFNAFVEYCSGNEARVIVVSPSPRDLTECLADSLRSHHVHAVPVYWNLVCRVFLEIIREHNLADLIRVSRFPDEVVRRYNQLLNGYN